MIQTARESVPEVRRPRTSWRGLLRWYGPALIGLSLIVGFSLEPSTKAEAQETAKEKSSPRRTVRLTPNARSRSVALMSCTNREDSSSSAVSTPRPVSAGSKC